MNLSKVLVGMPRWNRPTHEANRDAILAGQAKCICVPSTATRVVVEMWGQGGGGASASCCTWGIYGGQGGSYSNKVFTGVNSPAGMGTCIFFCGCVCTCDCAALCALGTNYCGHCGQFSWLKNCNQTGVVANWYGCTTGGIGGVPLCASAINWIDVYGNNPSTVCGLPYKSEYNTLCIDIYKKPVFALTNMSNANSSSYASGSMLCCGGASCFCAATLTSFTCIGTFNTNELTLNVHQKINTLNDIFKSVNCNCFDNYRLGACGFTDFNDASPLSRAGIWTCNRFSIFGIGGASYAGGAQQHGSQSDGNYAFQGWGGNFPGGGGRSSGACGGGACAGSIGGAGLIIISWN
jgi:hypothetical protein